MAYHSALASFKTITHPNHRSSIPPTHLAPHHQTPSANSKQRGHKQLAPPPHTSNESFLFEILPLTKDDTEEMMMRRYKQRMVQSDIVQELRHRRRRETPRERRKRELRDRHRHAKLRREHPEWLEDRFADIDVEAKLPTPYADYFTTDMGQPAGEQEDSIFVNMASSSSSSSSSSYSGLDSSAWGTFEGTFADEGFYELRTAGGGYMAAGGRGRRAARRVVSEDVATGQGDGFGGGGARVVEQHVQPPGWEQQQLQQQEEEVAGAWPEQYWPVEGAQQPQWWEQQQQQQQQQQEQLWAGVELFDVGSGFADAADMQQQGEQQQLGGFLEVPADPAAAAEENMLEPLPAAAAAAAFEEEAVAAVAVPTMPLPPPAVDLVTHVMLEEFGTPKVIEQLPHPTAAAAAAATSHHSADSHAVEHCSNAVVASWGVVSSIAGIEAVDYGAAVLAAAGEQQLQMAEVGELQQQLQQQEEQRVRRGRGSYSSRRRRYPVRRGGGGGSGGQVKGGSGRREEEGAGSMAAV